MNLTVEKDIEVRFNEVDIYNIVWHGNYAIYLESARQAFANKYGLGHKEMLDQGYYIPLTRLTINYKKPLVYNDIITVVIKYKDCLQTKILFDYEIYRKKDHTLMSTAESEQVIVGLDWNLKLFPPPYFQEWKDRWLTTNNHPIIEKICQ
jgi:acyl-CoA thioester hydrolase